MEKHDDEKDEVLSRDEMKQTKGGLKINDNPLESEGPLTPKQLLEEERDGEIGEDNVFAKGGKPRATVFKR